MGIAHIMCPINNYPRTLDEAIDPERGPGLLAYAIPCVACEPVSALLYEVGVTAQNAHRRWRIECCEPWRKASLVPEAVSLIELWRRHLIAGQQMPIIWRSTALIMKEIYRPLFTDNLRHADPTAEIVVYLRAKMNVLQISMHDKALVAPGGQQSGIALGRHALGILVVPLPM